MQQNNRLVTYSINRSKELSNLYNRKIIFTVSDDLRWLGDSFKRDISFIFIHVEDHMPVKLFSSSSPRTAARKMADYLQVLKDGE